MPCGVAPRVREDNWLTIEKRLSGASLLVFANKTDVSGCMDDEEIRRVGRPGSSSQPLVIKPKLNLVTGSSTW